MPMDVTEEAGRTLEETEEFRGKHFWISINSPYF
jgi:hypothetical protein